MGQAQIASLQIGLCPWISNDNCYAATIWFVVYFNVVCTVQQWRDALLQWNASEYDNVHQVVLQPQQIWTPDVVLINAYVYTHTHLFVNICLKN